MSNPTEYWIWADGQESGPYAFDDLFAAYVTKQLPAGFLWRRGDVAEFSPADELQWERTRVHPPPVAAPSVPPPISRPRQTAARKFAGVRLGAGTAIFLAVMLMAAAAIGAVRPDAGAGIIMLTILIMALLVSSNILTALHDIRELLAESNDLQRWRGGDDQLPGG